MLPQAKLDRPPYEGLCCHLLELALLGVLAATLLPAWGLNAGLFSTNAKGHHIHAGQIDRMKDQLASIYLLPALGFWLVLRRGALDLSVWAVAGLGGLVAAGGINAGLPPPGALALGVLAGLAVGAVNGLLAAWTRLSSPAFTLIVAAIIVAGAGAIVPRRAVRVPDESFGAYLSASETGVDDEQSTTRAAEAAKIDTLSPAQIRRLLVALVYAAAVVVLLTWGVAGPRRRVGHGDRVAVFAAMAASGALAAAGGAFWLVDHSSAPVPTRVVGDLRIPAAAVLAGGALWRDRRHMLLSGLFLPISLPISVMLVTVWRQEANALTWLRSSGYAWQLILLTAMILSAHLALLGLLRGRGARRAAAGGAVALIVAAVATSARQALPASHAAKQTAALLSVSLWAAAVAALAASVLWPSRRPRPGPGAGCN